MSTESVLDVGVHTLQKLHRIFKILLEDFCRGIETKLLFHVFRTKGAIKTLQLFNFFSFSCLYCSFHTNKHGFSFFFYNI